LDFWLSVSSDKVTDRPIEKFDPKPLDRPGALPLDPTGGKAYFAPRPPYRLALPRSSWMSLPLDLSPHSLNQVSTYEFINASIHHNKCFARNLNIIHILGPLLTYCVCD
jgi:hypothetical protein